MKFLLKLWKDPVISKVIASVILASLLWLLSAYSPALQSLLQFQIEAWYVILLLLLFFFSMKFYFMREYKIKELSKQKQQLAKRSEKYIRETNDLIWKTFYGLDDSDLILLNEIFNSPKSDPDNKRCRMIKKFDLEKYTPSIEKTNIPTGNRSYRLCIVKDYIGDKIHLTFEEYFYDLLECFSVSGEKKKL